MLLLRVNNNNNNNNNNFVPFKSSGEKNEKNFLFVGYISPLSSYDFFVFWCISKRNANC